MRILITGICGFVGQALARTLPEHLPGLEVLGLDNLIRPGSELNRHALDAAGARFFHADIRCRTDIETLPAVDWVIDAAANASVLAGLDHAGASRQLLEHNLAGTINLLEFCRRHKAGFILLSTNRVYAIEPLRAFELEARDQAFHPVEHQAWPAGCSQAGIAEAFSTQPPLSLYGSTKLASEILAQEYGAAFGFPVWINRCGVIAGAGQFGRPDQGIFSYWIHAYAARRRLKYTGFGGQGFQVRDALHPADLAPVLVQQLRHQPTKPEPALNFAGGTANAMSLAQLSDWCAQRFGPHQVEPEPAPRPYDIPWMVLDCRAAAQRWQWRPQRRLESLLEEIAAHAQRHPDWLDLTSA